ncbi:unnamed protein product [Prorocentrum cordatum]|uniref:DUF3987 domain-containing protein n=1 Tax=Prorocentrum cordatum TaxID=2364126 RepID=A0ABN9X9D4_9DINO|nr:unnamed protein product [Polarella glacialis]
MESQDPFPEEVARRAPPLMWAIATALGKATSLHPSCVYVHILLLIATTLGAVQLKYGGILARHCNLLMLQHGEPGDGKSIALWLDVQILSYYDQVREARAKRRYDAALERHERDLVTEPKPEKKPEKDSIFNKGTFIGLGGFTQAQEDTAFLALHEGKTWLPQTFDSGPGGGIDDLNQIHDHDLYNNHPGNSQNRFRVRSPHLCGAVMMHVEEVYDQAHKPDSTAGMMRFLVGHFIAVVNKILPDLPPPQLARILDSDPNYFNDLTYDDVVEALGGGVTLVSSLLFPKGKERRDERGSSDRFSRARGTHFLPWAPEFNKSADFVRGEARASKGDNEDSGYSAVQKDMTRTPQFIPPIDVGEKVVGFLLGKAGKSDSQVQEMTGEVIVECLGKRAHANIDALLDDLGPSHIPPEVTRPSVDAAVALGDWFAKNFQMTVRAKEVTEDFMEACALRIHAAPHPRVNPMLTLQRIDNNWNVTAFAQNPFTTDAGIRALQLDYVILTHMGFLFVEDGRVAAAAYAADSESFVRAANRMMKWDPSVVLRDLRELAPEGAAGAREEGDQGVADQICQGLKDMLDGKPVDLDPLRALEAPLVAEVRGQSVPASQVGAPPPVGPPSQLGASAATASGLRLAQAAPPAADEAGTGGSRKRMRTEAPLAEDSFEEEPGLKKRILVSILSSAQNPYAAAKNKSSFTGATPEVIESSMRLMIRFAGAAGFGTLQHGGSAVQMHQVPAEHKDAVYQELQSRLGLTPKGTKKMNDANDARVPSSDFDFANFMSKSSSSHLGSTDTVRAVITLGIGLKYLDTFIEQLVKTLSPDAKGWIVDLSPDTAVTGTLLASFPSDLSTFNKSLILATEASKAGSRGDYLETISKKVRDDHAGDWLTLPSVVKFDYEQDLVQAHRISDGSGLEWLFVLSVPREVFWGNLTLARNFTIIGVCCLTAGMCLVLFILSCIVSKHLMSLGKKMALVAEMKVDSCSSEGLSMYKEVSGVSEMEVSFKTMKQKLREFWTDEQARHQKREESHRRRLRTRVLSAIADADSLRHPMVLCKASCFVEMGGLRSYESLRDAGKLVVLDTMEKVANFESVHAIIFFSHQWLGWGQPDPDNVHHQTMVNAIRQLKSGTSLCRGNVQTFFNIRRIRRPCGAIRLRRLGLQPCARCSLHFPLLQSCFLLPYC